MTHDVVIYLCFSCVQKLRRKVAVELERAEAAREKISASEEGSVGNLSAASGGGSSGSLSTGRRYTSRNMVTMSGLSVSDPQPKLSSLERVFQQPSESSVVDSEEQFWEGTPSREVSLMPLKDAGETGTSEGNGSMSRSFASAGQLADTNQSSSSSSTPRRRLSRSYSWKKTKSMADFYYGRDEDEENTPS